MELKKAIETRTSIRSFLADEVPEQDIREMVRLAGLAPSVNNFQPWGFILIRNKKTLQIMSRIVSSKLDIKQQRQILCPVFKADRRAARIPAPVRAVPAARVHWERHAKRRHAGIEHAGREQCDLARSAPAQV